MARTGISLCMIVRDEAAMLPALLESVRGLWDELLAVDTGSTDGTPALLAAAGARVLHLPWTGDFSAARNAGLDAAWGEHLLVLDADERVSPGLAEELRRAAADPACGAASLVVESPLPHGHVRRSRMVRMFRRDPAVRYRHAIHEDVSEASAAYLARTGLQRLDLSAPLLHLGYVREHALSRNKKERDVGLLRAALARDGSDLYARLKLLEQARFWGDASLLAEAAEETARHLSAVGPGALAGIPWAGELLALAVDGLGLGPGAAAAWLDRLVAEVTPSAAFFLRRGELRELSGDARGAGEDFERCLALEGATGHVQLATVRPLLGLARLALARGDVSATARAVDLALARAPLDPEALLLAAVLHRALGGPTGLARFGEERRALGGDAPELAAALREAEALAG